MSVFTLNAGVFVLLDNESLFLLRKIELPFLPAIGMDIRVYDADGAESIVYEIQNLTWDVQLQEFHSMFLDDLREEVAEETEIEVFLDGYLGGYTDFGWKELTVLNAELRKQYDYMTHGPQLVKP